MKYSLLAISPVVFLDQFFDKKSAEGAKTISSAPSAQANFLPARFTLSPSSSSLAFLTAIMQSSISQTYRFAKIFIAGGYTSTDSAKKFAVSNQSLVLLRIACMKT